MDDEDRNARLLHLHIDVRFAVLQCSFDQPGDVETAVYLSFSGHPDQHDSVAFCPLDQSLYSLAENAWSLQHEKLFGKDSF